MTMNRRDFLKASLLAGVTAAFAPQLLVAKEEKLIITDWLHFEFAGELSEPVVEHLAKMVSAEITEYLEQHPTHRLVTVTNEWANHKCDKIMLNAAREYQIRTEMEYAIERGKLDPVRRTTYHEISYAIHVPERAHLIKEDVKRHSVGEQFIPATNTDWQKKREKYHTKGSARPRVKVERLFDGHESPRTWTAEDV